MPAEQLLTININTNAWIRLNLPGRLILRKKGIKEPPEDVDGWSCWQMWQLFEAFGDELYPSFDPPFETQIRIRKSDVSEVVEHG